MQITPAMTGLSGLSGLGTVVEDLDTPITDGLVAYWSLNESSGSRAAAVGGLTLTQQGTVGSATGISGLAASFDGTSKHLWAANNSALQFGDSDWTLSCWVKVANATSGFDSLLAKGNRNTAQEVLIYRSATQIGVYLYNGVTTVVANPFISGAASTNWTFIALVHRASEKSLTLVVNEQAKAVAYTVAAGVSTSVFAIGSNPVNGTTPSDPANGLIGHVAKWSRALSLQDILAQYYSGAGQFYPYSGFQRTTVTDKRVILGVGIGGSVDTVKSTNTQGTFQTRDNGMVFYNPASKLTVGWANSYSNFGGGFPNSENQGNLTNAVTLRAALYADGRGVATQLTFGGQTSVTIPAGEIVYCDEVDVGIFTNQALRVRTEVSVASGSDKWPATYQYATPIGWTVLGTSNVLLNPVSYAPGADAQYHFGPCVVLGRVPTSLAVGNRRFPVGVRGDSISPYVQTAMSTGLVPFVYLGMPGESINDLTRTGADSTRTNISKRCHVIVDQYGVNDIRASRTAAQIIADKTAMWTTWCTASSVVRIVAPSITPLPGFSTTERNLLNSWLAGLNSASVSALVGKTVDYQFVDVASCVETSAGSNTWVVGQSSDNVHPNATGYATIQSNFGAALVTAVSLAI